MNRKEYLIHLENSVRILVNVIGEHLNNVSESKSQFSVQSYLKTTSLRQTLMDLAPYTDILDTNLNYQIQLISGLASLKAEGLIIGDWDEDQDLSPPIINQEADDVYKDLSNLLSQRGECIKIEEFSQNIEHLSQAGASTSVSLRIFINKDEIISRLNLPGNVSGLLYIVTEKCRQYFNETKLPILCNSLIPGSHEAVILMLGNVTGSATGPNIRVYGLDYWSSESNFDFQVKETDAIRVRDANKFRIEEGHWDVSLSGITPHHVYIEETTVDSPEIVNTISQIRDRLSVLFLADRVLDTDKGIFGIFKGYKRTQIKMPPINNQEASSGIFKLFDWTYENSSSDKFGIVKQIITLQVSENVEENYFELINKATSILGSAKSNFNLYLRRSVEMYFDKRLMIGEYIRKFSEEVGKSVSKLTSELINNLYKTVGVILGVVIAAILDTKQISLIAFLTSLLYSIYIFFILVYFLPASYLQFRSKVRDYEKSVLELKDVLSQEEIDRIQGNSFERERTIFLIYFGVTNSLYVVLGTVAYLLMTFFRNNI